MSILPELAYSLGRRDEVPNQELAAKIAGANNKAAIKELVANLQNKSKDIQHDCIKVLYEIGLLKPALISGYLPVFLSLLQSKNNRMQWGAMAAIDNLATRNEDAVFAVLPQIIDAADKGSVITRDRAVSVLIKLCRIKKYYDDAFELLMDQLRNSPHNQFPMYAEESFPVINDHNREAFINVIRNRLPDMETESKKKRLEKLVKKFKG
jgi:hypothetical protein